MPDSTPPLPDHFAPVGLLHIGEGSMARVHMYADNHAKAYAAPLIARVAELEAALQDAVTRMDRTRDILTDGKPTPQCNWGMLDTNTLRAALASKPPQGEQKRCGYCDDTGDVHSIDGEWRGRCTCPAGQSAPQPEPVAPPAREVRCTCGNEWEWNSDQTMWELAHVATPPAQAVQDSQAVRDVLSERERQKSVEGWTPEHDDEHGTASMAAAAGCYAFSAASEYAENTHWSNKRFDAAEQLWPWDREWWKPSTSRRDLVKAGALIIAEIERLDRAARTRGNGVEPS